MIATTGEFERKSFSPSIVGYDSCKNSLDAAVNNAMSVEDGQFVLMGRLSLPDPILALRKVDMTGDGLLEIGVLSLKGLHILQVSVCMFVVLVFCIKFFSLPPCE